MIEIRGTKRIGRRAQRRERGIAGGEKEEEEDKEEGKAKEEIEKKDIFNTKLLQTSGEYLNEGIIFSQGSMRLASKSTKYP